MRQDRLRRRITRKMLSQNAEPLNTMKVLDVVGEWPGEAPFRTRIVAEQTIGKLTNPPQNVCDNTTKKRFTLLENPDCAICSPMEIEN